MMTFTGTFTATKRMIDRVHRHTTNGRAHTKPPSTTSFAELGIHTIFISHNTDCRITFTEHPARFT